MSQTVGVLRIGASDALPFAREKLRACLEAAGLRPVVASQVTAGVSHALRASLPAELSVDLSDDLDSIRLGPTECAGRWSRLPLPTPAKEHQIDRMRSVLARLTREELMHDLERQVRERTADLEEERQRSERLLKNMLPNAIAQRIKNGESIADSHEATVLFADLVGFTSLASERSASEVVALLDRIFTAFDEVARRHQLEKIKTIGDSYMAAAGLPIPQADHVDRAVLMGLDLVALVEALRTETGANLSVRVGIHTGPLVAGVIGKSKYAYDVWGDTVNVASRLESQGVPGRVQISAEVRAELGNRYDLEERGTIEAKNRGRIRTWFVNRIRALRTPDTKA